MLELANSGKPDFSAEDEIEVFFDTSGFFRMFAQPLT
jgi:hypothetical protein